MTKQCKSCGGDCGRTEKTGCRYKVRASDDEITREEKLYAEYSRVEDRMYKAISASLNGTDTPLLTGAKLKQLHSIQSKWGYNTGSAVVHAYLHGINMRRKTHFDCTEDHLSEMNKAEAMWGTENTPHRESRAFRDGFHAAMLLIECEK